MSYRYVVAGCLAAIIALALFISPFVSSSPDGLEKVADERGFVEKGHSVWTHAPMPGYQLPWAGRKSGALAGVIGTLLTFGAAFGTAFAVSKRKRGGKGR